MKMKLLHNVLFLSLIAGLSVPAALGQQCDMVMAALRKDFVNLLDKLNVHIDGNSSCSKTCDGIEGKVDALEAKLDEELNDVLQARLDVLLINITEQVGSLQLQLNRLHRHGRTPSLPAVSCTDILHFIPDSPSGYYWIGTNPSSSSLQYCDMTRSCGGVTGGWMRVAYLDMTNSSHQCPSGLTLSNRRCKRGPSDAGCSSITFRVETLGYSKVCGKIRAYQSGTPDSFFHSLPHTWTPKTPFVDICYQPR
jgi:hypothetical protein